MEFTHWLLFGLPCFWIEGGLASPLLLERETVAVAPNCSLACLSRLIPEFCGSASNTTCVCDSDDLTDGVYTCAYSECSTIPELLQLQKYSAVSCGVKNDKTRLNQVVRMGYVVPALTAIFVGGRIFAGVRLSVRLEADDLTILVAAATYFISAGTSLGLILNNFGQHTYWLSVQQLTAGRKCFYVVQLFYILSITLTKLALLIFFLRIFPDRKLRKVIRTTGLFIFLSNLCILMALSMQCVPLHGYWTNWKYKDPRVKCIDGLAALESAAVFSIVQSIMILAIPVPTVWRLNLAWKKKANLLIMFSVGSVALASSLLRLPSIINLDKSSDLSYDQAPVVLYSHLEASVGIICACLPACRSLLEHFFPSLKMSFSDNHPTAICYQENQRQSATPPRSRTEVRSSSMNLVDVNKRPDVNENGIKRLSSRTLTCDDESCGETAGDQDLGVHATVETRPSLGLHDVVNDQGIYTKKTVEIFTDNF